MNGISDLRHFYLPNDNCVEPLPPVSRAKDSFLPTGARAPGYMLSIASQAEMLWASQAEPLRAHTSTIPLVRNVA